MSFLRNNPKIDLSGLHPTGVTFSVNHDGTYAITDERSGVTNLLSSIDKGKNRSVFGIAYDGVKITIDAVVGGLPRRRCRFPYRVINIDGVKLGTLKLCQGVRQDYFIISLPLHHKLGNWETLYYDHTIKDVQIYNRGCLFAVAKYEKGIFSLLISKNELTLQCLALALAAIDSKRQPKFF